MDNTKIYEYAFYCMLNNIKHTKEQLSEAQSVMNDIYRPVLYAVDDNTNLFTTVIRASERSIVLEMCKLIIKLFENNGIQYERFICDGLNDDPLYYLYMPFYRIEENKRVAYIFDMGMLARQKKWTNTS